MQNQQSVVVKNYTLFLPPLGSGAFGKVYKGYRTENPNVFYGVKEVDSSSLGEVQWKRELGVLKKFDHPNILKMIDIFDDGGKSYIVMPLCERGDLSQIIARKYGNHKGIVETEATWILMQALVGFRELHKDDVLHRDIKPANLFVADQTVLIGDFGFARFSKEGNTIMGTPAFMAPEILAWFKDNQGRTAGPVSSYPKYDRSADLWSLAISYYLLLFGVFPWNFQKDPPAIYKEITKNGFVFPSTSKFSGEVKDLLTRILRIEPSERMSWETIRKHELFRKLKEKFDQDPNTPKTEGWKIFEPPAERVSIYYHALTDQTLTTMETLKLKYSKSFPQANTVAFNARPDPKELPESIAPMSLASKFVPRYDPKSLWQMAPEEIYDRFLHIYNQVQFYTKTGDLVSNQVIKALEPQIQKFPELIGYKICNLALLGLSYCMLREATVAINSKNEDFLPGLTYFSSSEIGVAVKERLEKEQKEHQQGLDSHLEALQQITDNSHLSNVLIQVRREDLSIPRLQQIIRNEITLIAEMRFRKSAKGYLTPETKSAIDQALLRYHYCVESHTLLRFIDSKTQQRLDWALLDKRLTEDSKQMFESHIRSLNFRIEGLEALTWEALKLCKPTSAVSGDTQSRPS